MVEALGEIGDLGTATLLRDIASDPEIGQEAVAAVRAIDARTSPVGH
ncbi:MAG TPA: hypothetical protein VHS74_09785 [Solirubrobacterales bacterium]|jgi:hypothetical protein|nr:hypothetical protein [Solirubrobacterales bacterium]